MERSILSHLKAWKHQDDRLPLLVRGARQVGKTTTIEHFGAEHFTDTFKINFELQREFLPCFYTLYPNEILQKIYAISGKSIKENQTLLFLDEIQECPNAIMALRYFYEMLPNLHVIAAGSLLEFTLNDADFRMPVGRVQSCYLKPMSFVEYLIAAGKKSLVEYMQSVTLQTGLDDGIHQQLLKQLREYLVLGGMPAVLKNYFQTPDYEQAQIRQNVLLDTYQRDFRKYGKETDIKYLQRLFEKAPGMVAQQLQYKSIDAHMHSRDLKRAVEQLKKAGVIHTVKATTASGLPLATTANDKKYKLLMLDVGMVNCAMRLSAEILMDENLILLHRGAIAEQFVGQELLAYAPFYRDEELYFWHRDKPGASSEVDYVIAIGSDIYPVEVKAGSTGRLKAMQIYIDEKEIDFGIRVSQNTLSFGKRILSIPLYMISQLPRLISELH